ncbi:glycosyltransferase [Olsenella urininfantis]|uniref:glycosyltransferase n=1 Tax=Olsenella urininfantis TaxID=1871033 RepID=UPI001F3428BA|nr:glycosyltransferase [Olsenella urininfantis]
MDNALVSVLVPIFNVERYLDQCLDSLSRQSYQNLEILCINDGSTDGSRAIIESYASADARFKLIDKPNSGYGDSMNRGLELARGKYISILESDDFLDFNAIEYMVSMAEADRLEVFKCNFWLYWSEGRPEYSYRNDVYFTLATSEMVNLGVHAPRNYPDIFWKKPSIWSALYLKRFLDENGIRFLPTPGASYQDSSFTFKVFSCAERARYSGKAFLHYRQDNEQSSVNSPGKVYCICDEHAEMRRFLDEERPELRQGLDPVRAYVKFLNYAWNYDRLTTDLKSEFLDRFSLEMHEEVERGSIPEGVLDGSYASDDELALYQYFTLPQVASLRQVLYKKDVYAAVRSSRLSASKLETMKNFWSIGGASGVAELVKLKLREG